MSGNNIFYAQSGGVTAVINATAAGVIEGANANDNVGKVFAGEDGILGALNEKLIDTSKEPQQAIEALKYTPGSAFGTCRYKMKSIEENRSEYERLIEVFSAHNIGYFFYNGGGDSQDTAYKVSQIGDKLGYPITCIGLPKTVDNDLPHTDNCPGFGSAAKYLATSVREAGMDVASMASSSTRVFIIEVMGRHTGWLAAGAGLASEQTGMPPHVVLLPEVAFDQKRFLAKVDECVKSYGSCTVVASEGLRDQYGHFISESGTKDAFGNVQLGGVAPAISKLVKSELGYKNHYAISDYLQRSARHLASQTDLDHAYALGRAAVDKAVQGQNNVMLTIDRLQDAPYQWQIGEVALSEVARVEKPLPNDYITADGFHITDKCRRYIQPLIQGEAYPPYENGLPDYIKLKNELAPTQLGVYENN